MSQERLSSLAILSIENEILRAIEMTDVVKKFIHQIARKKSF